MLQERNAHSSSELDALSTLIFTQLLALDRLRDAQTVCTYVHIGSEVRTTELIHWALSEGKSVLVPIIDKTCTTLRFSEIKDLDRELEPGTFGVLEPKSEFRRITSLEKADAILVPGVAWDLRGYRLGYGAGLYDRSINALQTPKWKIGLAFTFQIIPELPASRFDTRVEQIVSDRRTITTISEPDQEARNQNK